MMEQLNNYVWPLKIFPPSRLQGKQTYKDIDSKLHTWLVLQRALLRHYNT